MSLNGKRTAAPSNSRKSSTFHFMHASFCGTFDSIYREISLFSIRLCCSSAFDALQQSAWREVQDVVGTQHFSRNKPSSSIVLPNLLTAAMPLNYNHGSPPFTVCRMPFVSRAVSTHKSVHTDGGSDAKKKNKKTYHKRRRVVVPT